MDIFTYAPRLVYSRSGKGIPGDTLAALRRLLQPGHVTALVGGGGKSSTMLALGAACAAAGGSAVLATTTHLRRPPVELPLVSGAAELEALRAAAAANAALPPPALAVAGILSPETGKLGPPAETGRAAACKACTAADALAHARCAVLPETKAAAELLALAAQCSLLLIEADGSKGLPAKVPAAHEPALPACADSVIAVLGLSALGRPIGEVCHRPEQVCALLSTDAAHRLAPQDCARLLYSERGLRKGVGPRRFAVVLNQADTPGRAALGAEIAAFLPMDIPCAITAYPLREVPLL